MKLINKFTFWYLIITTFVLITGSIITISRIQHEIFEEEVFRLKSLTDDIVNDLSREIPISSFTDKCIKIKELDKKQSLIQFHIIDTVGWYSQSEGMERVLIAKVSCKVNGKHYLIQTSSYIIDTEEIRNAVVQSISWIFLILLVFVVLAGRQLSNITLSPLKKILQSIQSFSLKQKEPIRLPVTRIKEFSELNLFLEKMTSKATEDYRLLKEFTENTSHEIQTPLSVVRGKLELLMESAINEEQSQLILAAHNSIDILSRINQSLILLAKLENHEYDSNQQINLSKIIESTLSFYIEMMEMKSIHLHKEIQKKVILRFNPVLADILLSNLISNSIRHNQLNGTIHVKLTQKKLIIENTGNPPKIRTSELFQRFKKSNQNTESIGLGLAIVKEICDLNNFHIEYNYYKHLHTIEIRF